MQARAKRYNATPAGKASGRARAKRYRATPVAKATTARAQAGQDAKDAKGKKAVVDQFGEGLRRWNTRELDLLRKKTEEQKEEMDSEPGSNLIFNIAKWLPSFEGRTGNRWEICRVGWSQER